MVKYFSLVHVVSKVFSLSTTAGVLVSVSLFFLLSPSKAPHWAMQVVLGVMAIIMSIAWLNIEANETIAVLEAYGLVFGIDTGKESLMGGGGQTLY